jgi:hypothetical protein
MLRKLLITGAMALSFASLVSASTVVSYTSSFGTTSTDILNTTLAMQKFDPSLLSVPVGFTAVLKSFTVSYSQTISTTNLTVTNTGATSGTVAATISSVGYLYLFNPTPASWTIPGPGLNPLNLPNDDVFAGGGPAPSYSRSPVALAAGATSAPVSRTNTQSATSGVYNDAPSLALVQSNWNAYVDTFTSTFISVSGTGGGIAEFSNFANGSVTVNYSYDLESGVPEPATMSLMGVALLGIGLARKKFRS